MKSFLVARSYLVDDQKFCYGSSIYTGNEAESDDFDKYLTVFDGLFWHKPLA